MLGSTEWWGSDVTFFGAAGEPDIAEHSRSIAWHLPGLYVMANMWWEPLDFDVQVAGEWRRIVDTTDEQGVVDGHAVGASVEVGPRSVVVLFDESAATGRG